MKELTFKIIGITFLSIVGLAQITCIWALIKCRKIAFDIIDGVF